MENFCWSLLLPCLVFLFEWRTLGEITNIATIPLHKKIPSESNAVDSSIQWKGPINALMIKEIMCKYRPLRMAKPGVRDFDYTPVLFVWMSNANNPDAKITS